MIISKELIIKFSENYNKSFEMILSADTLIMWRLRLANALNTVSSKMMVMWNQAKQHKPNFTWRMVDEFNRQCDEKWLWQSLFFLFSLATCTRKEIYGKSYRSGIKTSVCGLWTCVVSIIAPAKCNFALTLALFKCNLQPNFVKLF